MNALSGEGWSTKNVVSFFGMLQRIPCADTRLYNGPAPGDPMSADFLGRLEGPEPSVSADGLGRLERLGPEPSVSADCLRRLVEEGPG